jgi:DNA damage-binding protein 1
LEFYKFTDDGLELHAAKLVYGKITVLNKLRPASSPTDHLFVGTDRAHYFILSWNPDAKDLRTESTFRDLADRTARESQTGDRCWLDPTGEFLTIEVYEGIITTFPMARKGKRKGDFEAGVLDENPSVSRIPEFFVRSSAFLHSPSKNDKPRLALLYEDYEKTVRLRVRELNYTLAAVSGEHTVDFDSKGHTDALDYGANILIPIAGPPCKRIGMSVDD